jgi:hypothetical protein
LIANDAKIEFHESLFGAVADVRGLPRIISDAAEPVGASPQNAIEVDGFEIGFSGASE